MRKKNFGTKKKSKENEKMTDAEAKKLWGREFLNKVNFIRKLYNAKKVEISEGLWQDFFTYRKPKKS